MVKNFIVAMSAFITQSAAWNDNSGMLPGKGKQFIYKCSVKVANERFPES